MQNYNLCALPHPRPIHWWSFVSYVQKIFLKTSISYPFDKHMEDGDMGSG